MTETHAISVRRATNRRYRGHCTCGWKSAVCDAVTARAKAEHHVAEAERGQADSLLTPAQRAERKRQRKLAWRREARARRVAEPPTSWPTDLAEEPPLPTAYPQRNWTGGEFGRPQRPSGRFR